MLPYNFSPNLSNNLMGPLNSNNPIYPPNMDINTPSKNNNIASLGNSNYIPPNYQGLNSSNSNSIALFKIPSSATNSLYVDGKNEFIMKIPLKKLKHHYILANFYNNSSLFYSFRHSI